MASNAKEYAESLGKRLWSLYEAGAPFGWYNEQTDTHTEYKPEGWESGDDEPTEAGWRAAYPSEWLGDILEFRYVVGSDMSYRSAEVAVSLGGPNAWVTTDDAMVTVYWGGDVARWSVPYELCEGIDEYLGEMFEVSR